MTKKSTYYFTSILFLSLFYNSCSDKKEKTKMETLNDGLKKGTEEYNLGLIKIFKFEADTASIDHILAKKLGFSNDQIHQMQEEINEGNLLIKESKEMGSIIEPYNPENLSAEEYLEELKNHN